MPIEFHGGRVLLDIEGTIAPIAFVYDVLFPYARARLADFLAARWQAPQLAAIRAQIALDADDPLLNVDHRDQLTAHLLSLMDRDAKSTGLKQLQGLIWKEGFESAELKARVFDDVPPTLRAWHAAGLDIRIYSSGSILAQRLFLRHTEHGDLTPCLRGYYDTTVGPKTAPDSYLRIAAEFNAPPHDVLFVSDAPAELDAAAHAGLTPLLAVRPGNRPVAESPYARLVALHDIQPAPRPV